MRVLVLTFYFRPDLSAGSFRTTPLVEELARVLPAGSALDVVTTLPNRYHTFSADAPAVERDGKVAVTRIALPPHRSGMLDQSKAFLTFARAARRAVAGREYDVVYATSSRLMTAVLGATIARRKKAPLYLDVRDIFVDTIKDVASKPVVVATAPIFTLLERFAIRSATRVNVVSEGFLDYFRARYPSQRFATYTNGIDGEFLDAASQEGIPEARTAGEPVTILYAGNIGEGQGLHAIVPQLARRLGDRIRIQIVGDGGRKGALEQAIADAGARNVEIHPPVPRAELLRRYKAADVLFLHLNDYDAFRKVLPSKVFEYGALGKPILAGVAGFAAQFVRSELDNAAVFEPCHVEDAVRAFDSLRIADAPRSEFIARFGRAAITRELARDILSVANGSSR